MPPKRAQRSRSRQTTPQSPPKQRVSHQSPLQARRGTRSTSHDTNQSPVQKNRSEKSLPALNEEVDEEDDIEVIEVVQPDLPSEAGQGEIVADDQDESEDNISDTTSDGATQLDALDLDLVIDSLSSLYQNAAQILSLIHSKGADELVQDFSTPLSKLARRLSNFAVLLNASRQAYGTGSYIDIPLILRKLTEESNITEGPWRPDPVLQFANLSLLVVNLSQNDQTAIYDTLERMFNTFPEPFGNFHLTIGETKYSTQLVTETVSFGIALRTQFFIRFVEQSKNDAAFDPDLILEKVFFDEDGNLNGFQLEGEEISIEAENEITKQLQRIRKYFKTKSTDPIDMKRLKQAFPRQKFLKEAFHWISLRKQELDAQIVAQGGVDSIKYRLENNDFTPYEEQTPYTAATPEVEHAEDIDTSQVHHTKHQTPKQPGDLKQPATIEQQKRDIGVLKRAMEQDGESSEEDDEDEEIDEEADEDEEDEEEDVELQEPERRSVKDVPTPKRTPLKGPLRDLQSTVAEIPQTPENVIAEADETRNAANDNDINDAEDNFADSDDEVVEPEDEPTPDQNPPRPTQSSIVPTQQTLAVLQVAREQATLGNKENLNGTRRSYLDKQPGAKRIEWDESQTGQKRSRRRTDSDEEDEDEQFETDNRPQKRARLPRLPPPDAADEWLGADGDDEIAEQPPQSAQNTKSHSARTTPKPPRATQPNAHRSPLQPLPPKSTTQIPSSSAPERHQRPPSTVPPASNHRARSSQSASIPPSSTPAEAHLTVNARAKATMRMREVLEGQPTSRPAQVRRAWTVAETNRLFEMLAIHGCAWAQILDEDLGHPDGSALQGRTQVQLKDKARNLKMDYLKAGAELPEGFSAVTIKSRDKELLTSLGLPFE